MNIRPGSNHEEGCCSGPSEQELLRVLLEEVLGPDGFQLQLRLLKPRLKPVYGQTGEAANGNPPFPPTDAGGEQSWSRCRRRPPSRPEA